MKKIALQGTGNQHNSLPEPGVMGGSFKICTNLIAIGTAGVHRRQLSPNVLTTCYSARGTNVLHIYALAASFLTEIDGGSFADCSLCLQEKSD